MKLQDLRWLGVALLLVGCPQQPVPPPGPDADAAPPAPLEPDAEAKAATCASWCAHATSLGCVAAKPTAKGSTCVEVCNNVQSGPAQFKLKCRVSAKTCVAADACEQ